MLHRCPLRRPRLLLLFICAASVFLVALVLALFYAVAAPNWDVPLCCAAAALLLLLPVGVLLRPLFGFRTLQVEHAGVVLGEYLFGRCLRRCVFQAVELRHFDWEIDAADSLFTLHLLIQRHSDARPAFITALHTDNAYLAAAVWHDLELHYPGSGLREAPPAVLPPRARSSRFLGALLLFAAAALAMGTWVSVFKPLSLCAQGQVGPARVQRVLWDSAKPGSTYHLQYLPQGCEHPRRGIAVYNQGAFIPPEGAKAEILWAPELPYCCNTAVVQPFLLPLFFLPMVLLPGLCGLWCFLPADEGKPTP